MSDATTTTLNGFAPGTFLGVLEPAELGLIECAGRRLRQASGATLFVEGEGAGRVLILTQGRAKVFATSGTGRSVVLGVRGPGDIVGELSAVDGHARIASATMLEVGEILAIPTETFQRFLGERAAITAALVRVLAARLRDADRSRAMFGGLDCPTRLAQILVGLAETQGRPEGDATLIDIALTQQDLADWVGASREAVTKALHTFRERDLIATHRRAIVVNDLPGLRRRAG